MNMVKTIINEWDPLDLLSHAPGDEYHMEIRQIEGLLESTKDATDLAKGIFNVFLEAFGGNVFQKSEMDCVEIAKLLLNNKIS